LYRGGLGLLIVSSTWENDPGINKKDSEVRKEKKTRRRFQDRVLATTTLGASMNSYRAKAHGLLSLATLLDLMSKFFHTPYYPLQSGVTISQSCIPSTPSLPESSHCSQMISFDLIVTSNMSDLASSPFALFETCEGSSRSHYPFLESPP
jgi:hypothetical protein